MIGKFALAVAITVAAVAPVAAQTVDPLQSETLIKKVINRPGTAWTFYGSGMSQKVMKDSDLPGTQFIRATVSQKGNNAWDSGAAYGVDKPIKAGDVIFFAVYLRAPEIKDGETAIMPGMGVSQDGAPYTPIAMTTAHITNRWGVYYAAAKATANYGRGQAKIGLQLAADKQVIDLGPAFALDLGPDYDIGSLPHN
jgi:hypothetical protein